MAVSLLVLSSRQVKSLIEDTRYANKPNDEHSSTRHLPIVPINSSWPDCLSAINRHEYNRRGGTGQA